MKTIFRNTLLAAATAAALLGGLAGCRQYLEVQPQSQVSIQDAFSSVATATNAVIGVYDELMGDNGYGIRISLYYCLLYTSPSPRD